jgi:hypothetical protein
MNKLTLSARSQDDDLDIVQIAPATPIFVLRESQPSDDQTQKKQPMWKRTGNSKWDAKNNDLQVNRAGKWKSQP